MGNFLTGLMVDTGQLDTAIETIQGIANGILGVIGVAVIFVAIWIAFKFFTADEEEKRKNAKGQLIYAIIGIVAIVAIIVLWNGILVPALEETSDVNRT